MKLSHLLLLSIISLITITSCKKELERPAAALTLHDTLYVHDTIRIRDTVRIHDTIPAAPLSRIVNLTQKGWQIDEVFRNISGTNTRYTRGGSNNTGTNYQNNYIKFNTDGSGTYRDDLGNSFPMTWSFTNANQRELLMNVSGFVTINWYMLELKDNYLHATSLSSNSLNTARYIQVP